MNRQSMTVGEFLLEPNAPVEARTRASAQRQQDIERTNATVSVKRALEDRARGFPWSYALGQVEAKMLDALDVGVGHILGTAWAKVVELAKYLDPEKYPPEDTILVHLTEHTIKSTFHPSLEVLLNEERIGDIQLDVEVALVVKGLILKIKAGKILEVQTGSCQAKGSVAIAGQTIVEKKLEPIILPGVIPLEPIRPIEA